MKESNVPVTGRTPFQKWLDKYQGILYLIPWIIGFVVFKAFPFGQSLYYSFTDMNFFKSGTTFVGLQNYITAFTTTKITKALIITFKYAFITVPLKLIFALFIAYILNFKIACVNLFRTVYYIPSILGGSVAIAVLWKAVFSKDGLLNTVLRAVTFGLVQGPEWLSDPHYALWIICCRVSDLPIDLGDVIIDPTLLYPIGDIGVEVVVVLQTVGIATRSVCGAFLVAVDAEGTDTEAYPRLGEQDGTFQFPDQGIHVLPAPIVPLRLAVSFSQAVFPEAVIIRERHTRCGIGIEIIVHIDRKSVV